MRRIGAGLADDSPLVEDGYLRADGLEGERGAERCDKESNGDHAQGSVHVGRQADLAHALLDDVDAVLQFLRVASVHAQKVRGPTETTHSSGGFIGAMSGREIE
jgi:hypothetical protein